MNPTPDLTTAVPGRRARLCTGVVCALALAACGGGGGGGDQPPPVVPPSSRALVWGGGAWGAKEWSATAPLQVAPERSASSSAPESDTLKELSR